MEIDIKCSECGKMTKNFDIEGVYYLVENPSSTFIVEDKIICPKCGKDISNKKCLVKGKDLLIKLLVANLCLMEGRIPEHLSKILPLTNKRDYKIFKEKAKAKVKLVEKF